MSKKDAVQQLKDNAYKAKTFLAESGVDCPHHVVIELLARMAGHKNYQTALAAAQKQAEQESNRPSGLINENDGLNYELPLEQEDVWIRIDNAEVHLIRTDEGVIVDIWAANAMGGEHPEQSTYAYRNELKADLLKEVEEGFDEAYELLIKLCKSKQIEVSQDCDQPGLWVWKTPSQSCEISFDSEKEAWVNAYEEIY